MPAYLSEWSSTKNLQIINAGEGVETREPSHIVDRKVNQCSHYGEYYGEPYLKKKNRLP